MTIEEINALLVAADAGIRAQGITAFNNNGGTHLQSALNKLQNMAVELQKDEDEEVAIAAE